MSLKNCATHGENIIRQLYNIILKNMKLIIRDSTSLFLLIIGPFLLIGLLALSFSSLGFNNITIGIINNYETGQETSLFQPLKTFSRLQGYENLDACISALKLQKIHICIGIKDGATISGGGNIKKITVYIDNTREIISLILIEKIKAEFSSQKEQISLESINTILDNLKEIVFVLEDSGRKLKELKQTIKKERQELYEIKSEFETIRNDLEERKDHLYRIKHQLENDITETSEDLDETFDKINKQITNAINKITSLRNFVYSSGINNAYLNQELDKSMNDLYELQNDIADDKQALVQRLENVEDLLQEFDSMIEEMDTIREVIDRNEVRIDNAIDAMNEYENTIDGSIQDMDENQIKMQKILNVDTNNIIKPLLIDYKPIYLGSKRAQEKYKELLDKEITLKKGDVQAIQILFPIITLMVIVFIGMLFSNIIVLEEVNSKAYFRNFLVPINQSIFFVGTLITSLMITLFQIMMLLFIGHFIFYLDIFSNFRTIAAIAVLSTMIFTLYGMAVGYMIRVPMTSVIVTIFIIIMNIIIAGILVPIERMSPFMSKIASGMPFSLSIKAIQQALFYNVQIEQMWGIILALIIHGIVMIVLVLLIKRITDKGYEN